jgi:predicted nucleotidyltransferase component of viral defense system
MNNNIEIKKWKDYTKIMGFKNLYSTEKDYLQEIVLDSIFYVSPVEDIIFIGGTAISKIYGSGRFSEELDFIFDKNYNAYTVENRVKKAINEVNNFYSMEYSKSKRRDMLRYNLKIKGPFYEMSHSVRAIQTIKLDINLYVSPFYTPNKVLRTTIYPELRPYFLFTLDTEEFAAEKIKAILERKTPVARDLYDLWILITKYKIKINMEMINYKLQNYTEIKEYNLNEFLEKVISIGEIWDKEMESLLNVFIPFNIVKDNVIGYIENPGSSR